MEKWKAVKGYEGAYEVSSKGKVRSLTRMIRTTPNGVEKLREIKGKTLKLYVSNKGYLFAQLSMNGKIRGLFVHVLVAQAFIENPHGYPTVNHKDENKMNNSVDNLEWCTYTYNNNYGTHKERVGEAQKNGIRSKPVAQYTLDGKYLRSFPSMREVWRTFGYKTSMICNCCRGKIKTAYNYKWEYEDVHCSSSSR